jgi:hypothetical protein
MLYQNVLNILTSELAIRFKENKKCKIAIFNFFLLSLYNQLLSICFLDRKCGSLADVPEPITTAHAMDRKSSEVLCN